MARAASNMIESCASAMSFMMYNAIWTQLRQMITCAHVILYLYSKYEVRRPEAEDLLSKACWVIDLFSVRWRKPASDARAKILMVAQVFGELVRDV